MKYGFIWLLALVLATQVCLGRAAERAEVIARTMKSVVKVIATTKDGESVGTAFSIYRERNRTDLLTNCHVVAGSSKVEVVVNGSSLPARVVGCDALSDLAVVESVIDSFPHDQPAALTFANPRDIRVGDQVMTLGFANNLEGDPSVNVGIISAINRSFPAEADCERERLAAESCVPTESEDCKRNRLAAETCQIGVFSDLIQTDATINHGSSGGPMLNMDGQVVGVDTYTTALGGPVNVYYVRSVQTAAPFARMLMAGGEIARADLGLDEIRAIPPDPHDFWLSWGGVAIEKFSPSSPASLAGLVVGDIIVEIEACPKVSFLSEDWLLCDSPYLNINGAKVLGIGSLENQLAFIPPGTPTRVQIVNHKRNCPIIIGGKGIGRHFGGFRAGLCVGEQFEKGDVVLVPR